MVEPKKYLKEYKHKFIRYMPDKIQPGIIYITVFYGQITFRCPCVRGEVIKRILKPGQVNPFWFEFDGHTVTLGPQIVSVQCQTHFRIINNKVVIPGPPNPDDEVLTRQLKDWR